MLILVNFFVVKRLAIKYGTRQGHGQSLAKAEGLARAQDARHREQNPRSCIRAFGLRRYAAVAVAPRPPRESAASAQHLIPTNASVQAGPLRPAAVVGLAARQPKRACDCRPTLTDPLDRSTTRSAASCIQRRASRALRGMMNIEGRARRGGSTYIYDNTSRRRSQPLGGCSIHNLAGTYPQSARALFFWSRPRRGPRPRSRSPRFARPSHNDPLDQVRSTSKPRSRRT